ncbi:SDR family mycofactocin-dependent oxidoreductase [Prauserella sediminis]|uniref:SDR family mycofactocin-dependent oxidoreductase n=1 Tax=Prauserella sediminis TaxID=577680 RepID=A0A839Y0L5_9PSEU|nr:SDR family mycofactocin-dependent oxidoreductase [Prauserella sediminis]
MTGAGRGQGRSHAVRMASEGADIIAVDLCEDIPSNEYPLATDADLAETAKLVESYDRRVITRKADVRERSQLGEAVEAGIAEFGRLDIVVANAGIAPFGKRASIQAYFDTMGTNYVGVLNSVEASLPHIEDGGSIICTGSTAALMTHGTSNPAFGPGGAGYTTSKRHIARLVHELAAHLAGRRIRVNAIHPYNVNTDMLHSAPMYRAFRPDLENPTREEVEPVLANTSPMELKWLEPGDVSDTVVFLACDESQYITGMQFKIDGGQMLPMSSPGVAD